MNERVAEYGAIRGASDAAQDLAPFHVLGAGPAGIAAAYALSRRQPASRGLEVLERGAGGGRQLHSFMIDGIWCDYGSHRFHPVAEPEVLADVKALLGDDLLLRPRHGRIRLGGRWIHFPLKLADALTRLPVPFAASLMADTALKPLRRKQRRRRDLLERAL